MSTHFIILLAKAVVEVEERIRIRRRPEERRAEIIQAAIPLFARQGFERTTTKEIAAKAGISEGTIYKYFTTKQEILFAFLEPVAFQTIPAFFKEHQDSDEVQLVRAFIKNRFTIFETNRDLLRVIFGEAMFNPSLAEGLHRMIAPASQVFIDHITKRVHEGVFRSVNPTIAARTLIGSLLMNFIVWQLLLPEDAPHIPKDELYDELTRIFLQGVLKYPDYHPVEALEERR